MWAGGGSASGALISARLRWSLPGAAEPEPVLLLLRPLVPKLHRRNAVVLNLDRPLDRPLESAGRETKMLMLAEFAKL